MRSNLLGGLALCLLLAATAFPKDKEDGGKELPLEPTKIGGLSVQVEPAKQEFAAQEGILLTISFTNVTQKTIELQVVRSLSTMVGKYTPTVKDAKTGDVWKPVRDPRVPLPGIPAQLQIKKLAPGESLATKYHLPGLGMQWTTGKATSRTLPPGPYDVTLELALPTGKGKSTCRVLVNL